MSILEAILYGLVQGITEYLPVSSSAHLVLLPKFLGTEDPGLSFDVFLHLGTLAATLLYFRADWFALIRGRSFHFNRLSFSTIAIATFPALAIGALFHSHIESSLRGTLTIALALSLGGILLYALDRFCTAKRDLAELKLKDAIWVGLIQCLSLIPGFSRSGSTIMAGRALGFDRVSAARFSFLISAPVTAAAVLYEMKKWVSLGSESGIGWPALVAGGLSAFVFGWLTISFLLKLVRNVTFFGFALYRVVLALYVSFIL